MKDSLTEITRQKIEKIIADAEAQRNRTWTYYEKLRKENEKEYWKSETQKQLHQDAIDLGDAFLDD